MDATVSGRPNHLVIDNQSDYHAEPRGTRGQDRALLAETDATITAMSPRVCRRIQYSCSTSCLIPLKLCPDEFCVGPAVPADRAKRPVISWTRPSAAGTQPALPGHSRGAAGNAGQRAVGRDGREINRAGGPRVPRQSASMRLFRAAVPHPCLIPLKLCPGELPGKLDA